MIASTFLANPSGKDKKEALKMSLDNPRVFMMFIFPKRVSFLLFQEFRMSCKSFNLLSKFSLSKTSWL